MWRKEIDTPHRIVWTGTPIQKKLQELWSIFAFIQPGSLGTFPVLNQEFAEPIERGGLMNSTPEMVVKHPSQNAARSNSSVLGEEDEIRRPVGSQKIGHGRPEKKPSRLTFNQRRRAVATHSGKKRSWSSRKKTKSPVFQSEKTSRGHPSICRAKTAFLRTNNASRHRPQSKMVQSAEGEKNRAKGWFARDKWCAKLKTKKRRQRIFKIIK